MAIQTSGGNSIDFLGLTESVRKNILMAIVGNLSNAVWAAKVAESTTGYNISDAFYATNTDGTPKPTDEITPRVIQKDWMAFKDSDNLNVLMTDFGIWVKVYPTRGIVERRGNTGVIREDFSVYLTISHNAPTTSDGSDLIEPSTPVSFDEKGEPYIDEVDGQPDELNFARFKMAYRGANEFLTICDSNTPADGNEGRDVNVVAAINSARQQEIKFNRSTKYPDPEREAGWRLDYNYFALMTGPGTEKYPGRLIAWGKLTEPIKVKDADVVPLFEEGKFRLFFPAPNEVERTIDAEINDPEN